MFPSEGPGPLSAGRPWAIAFVLFLLLLAVRVRDGGAVVPPGWTVVSSTSEELRIDIEVPPAEIRTEIHGDRAYHLLRVKGYSTVGEPGLPLVPQRGAWIALPPEGEVRVSVELTSVEDLPPGPLLPSPVPKPPRPGQRENLGSALEEVVEGEGYSAWRLGTAEVARLGEPVWSNGQRMAPLRIRPFLVSQAGQLLQQVRRLTVVLRFPRAGSVSIPAYRGADEPVFGRVLNPKVARQWRAASPQDRLRLADRREGEDGAVGAAAPSGAETTAAAGTILPVDQMTLLSDEYRIPVAATGLVRVHFSDLFGALGFPTGIRRDQLRLYIKRPSLPGSPSYPVPLSEDVPLHFFGNPDPAGEITPADIIIFYGFSAQEDNIERIVGGQTLPAAMKQRADNYNSANIYWLAAADPGGGSWARMTRESFTAASGTPQASYDYQEHFGQDVYYQPNPVSPMETRYLWNTPFRVEERLPLRLRQIDPSSPLIVRWVFCSNLHLQQSVPVGQELKTSFYLENEDGSNRRLLKTLDINGGRGEFDPGPFGAPTAVVDTIPAGSFSPGGLRLRFHNVNESSSLFHLVMVDSVSLFYRTRYQAEAERAVFNTALAGSEVSLLVPGFTATEIFLVETTDPRAPRWVDLLPENLVVDTSGKSLSLQVPAEGSRVRSFVAVSSVEIPRVTSAEITRSSTPILTRQVGDLQAIALGPARFAAATQPWLQWRRDHDRRGWNYGYVDVQEVFDQFSGGLSSPDAIKEFLHFAHLQWGAKAVLLVGDANEDHRRVVRVLNQPAGVEDFVPTHIHLQFYGDFEVVGSDNWYVLFDIDDRDYPRRLNKGPDMLIGRWPAQNEQQVADMVAKVIAYEQPTESDTWRRRAIWMSDDAYSTGLLGGLQNPQYSYSFEETKFQSTQELFTAQTTAFLDGTMEGLSWDLDDWTAPVRGGQTVFPFSFLAEVQQEVATTARPALYATLGEGAFLLNYQGHANYNVFAHEQILLQIPGQSSPVDQFGNAGRPFLLFGLGCHASDFLRSTDLSPNDSPSFGETFVTHPTMGAIASYGSSAFEFLRPNLAFGQSITDAFFGPTRTGQVLDGTDAQWIMGDVLAQAEWDVFGAATTQVPQMVAQYALLGDPLLRMDGAAPRVSLMSDGSPVSEGEAVLPAIGARSLQLQVDAVDESGVDRIELIESVDGVSLDRSDLLSPQSGAGLDARHARSVANLPVEARGIGGGIQYELRVYDRAYPQLRPGVFRFEVPFDLVVQLDGDLLPPGGRPVAPGELVAFTLQLVSPVTLSANEIELELSGLGLEGTLQKTQQDTEGRKWEIAFSARGLAGATEQSLLLRLAGSETLISLAGLAPPAELAIKSHYPVPSPFDPSRGEVRIVADLTAPAQWARVTVYDLSGRPVVSWRESAPGSETTVVLHWDGRDRRGDELANGTYLYRLEVADTQGEIHQGDMGRIVLMR